jgi:NAD+ synthase
MGDAVAQLPDIDPELETRRICDRLREVTLGQLRRRGLVVAISGGVDSAVCAALAARAVGRERVHALLLPERASSSESTRLGRLVAEQVGVEWEVQDISPTLEALGCYSRQHAVLARVVPGFSVDWKFKVAIASAMGGRLSFMRLVAEDPSGRRYEQRLSAADSLELVAATNFKQRVRKTLEYFHADRLGYAVVGTPNRLEYDQGFFVKNGDGAADVKPIAHLYKTHVYALARHLKLPPEVVAATPTTDTYSLAQGQDEFYFGLPYAQMDLALWYLNEGRSAAELARALGTDEATARRAFDSILAKRRATAYLHAPPVLAVPVPEIGGEVGST